MLEGIGDIVKDSAAIQEVKVLEDHAHVPPQGLELFFTEGLLRTALGGTEGAAACAADGAETLHADAAGIGPLEKIDAAHQRALACAGIAHDAVYIPGLDVEGYVFHRVNGRARRVKGFVQFLDFDHILTLSNKTKTRPYNCKDGI